MTAQLFRKVRAGAPAPQDTRADARTAATYMERTAAEQDAVSAWAAVNPPKHTSTPAEREPQTDLKAVDWLLGFAFLAFVGLSGTGLYWLVKALAAVVASIWTAV